MEFHILSHPDDMKAAIACVELCREIGNSSALRRHSKREVVPGNIKGTELENFIRDATKPCDGETLKWRRRPAPESCE
jgi:choline dehydrogenase